jgi:hypothetical protein
MLLNECPPLTGGAENERIVLKLMSAPVSGGQ